MDSFELNKIIGAVLGTLLFVMGVGFLAEGIYQPIEDRGPGYTLPEPEGTEHGSTGGEEVIVASIGTLLASADPVEGQDQTRKCMSCHTLNQGGANGQGPNLWGVVGRPIASHEGFQYSPEMVAHAAEVPTWTYEELNLFLTAPKSRVPGTKMNFNGVKNDSERANIIAFLSTLSSEPLPFPPPEAAPAEGAAEHLPAATDATAPSPETNTAPTPASEGTTAPAATATEPVETTQGETQVEGTATGTNVPAGAEPTTTAPATGTTTPAPTTLAPTTP